MVIERNEDNLEHGQQCFGKENIPIIFNTEIQSQSITSKEMLSLLRKDMQIIFYFCVC